MKCLQYSTSSRTGKDGHLLQTLQRISHADQHHLLLFCTREFASLCSLLLIQRLLCFSSYMKLAFLLKA